MRIIYSAISFFFAIMCVVVSVPSYAQSTQWKKSDEVSARLIAGSFSDNRTLNLGLHFKIKKGWKTYWRTPGDGGLAMKIDWSRSGNVKSAKIKWPAPKRFIAFEVMENFAYKDEIIFPLVVTPKNPEEPVNVRITVDYAICDELCIFLTNDFSLDIPVGYFDKENSFLIAKYASKVPSENGSNGFSINDVFIENNEFLKVNVSSEVLPFNHPDLFVEGGEDFRFPNAKISFSEQRHKATFKIPYERLLDYKKLEGQQLELTLVDDSGAVFKNGTATTRAASSSSIIYILIVAFIGGLILNVMPCVLPILSLKLIGVIKHGGGENHHVRNSFLASAAGIIFSFFALAAIVISLRSIGVHVGWGFHFQQPLFLIALVVLLNLFAANQWSLFEINIPIWMGGAIQEQLTDKDHTPAGNFLTGVFATILATPCSAPYLGTAIGFALSRGAYEIILTFFFMGLGLAFPYIFFAFTPHLITRLPKPGAWMVKVKHLLGYLLAATSIWLIWVLYGQLGHISAIILLSLSVAMVLILISAKYKSIPSGRNSIIAVISIIIALSFYLPVSVNVKPDDSSLTSDDIWVKFDEDKISSFVNDGKIVFVDVTADWCLTCKFNKINVLSDDDIKTLLSNDNVIAMKADYTSYTKEISDFLQKYNRYGIPFNIVYGKDAPEGIMLSELLTEDALISAVKKADFSANY